MSESFQDSLAKLITERDELKQHGARLQALADQIAYPPGHHYSPLVDVHDSSVIRATRNRLLAPMPTGIQLDLNAMERLLQRLAAHYKYWPFQSNLPSHHRFDPVNPFFGCYDATIYFCILMEYKPRRVIEVGCGNSSCLLLDTKGQFFVNSSLSITFIDPAFDQLGVLAGFPFGTTDTIFRTRLQDVPLHIFDDLGENDILFIDSSHVCKTGSDVHFYLFDVLPRLKPGVLVHVHDILYPFEYPAEWVIDEKRSWNETYFIRAFLQNNSAFEVIFWNNLVYHHAKQVLAAFMPKCLSNEGGSLWLRKSQ